jgi:Protein of unknown function (DUF2505)
MEHVSTLPVPAHTTWAELTSEPFLRAFATEVGVEVHDLHCGVEDERAVAAMDWSFETDRPGIPELAKKFLPADVQLRWEQSWDPLADGSAAGRLDVTLHGRPSATSVGECLLVSTDPGSRLTTSTTTRADLPFPVRKGVESMIDKELVGWILSVQARVLLRRNPG